MKCKMFVIRQLTDIPIVTGVIEADDTEYDDCAGYLEIRADEMIEQFCNKFPEFREAKWIKQLVNSHTEFIELT